MTGEAMNLWIVIITYNAENWICNCLNSVKSSTIAVSVVVVDNNSSDKTATLISEKYPDCVLLRNKTNKGFGSANNMGIMYAIKQKADYVALLNQDAKLHPLALQKLLHYSIKYPKYGILAPMFYSYDGSQLDEYQVKWTYSYNLTLASDIFFQRAKEVYDVPLVPAAMWLIKREAIEEAGLFDPLFFMYSEDDDLWRRFNTKGWKTGFFPEVAVFHHTSKNSNYTLQKRIWYKYGNHLLNLKNPDRSFMASFFSLVQQHIANSISALISLNHSELYVLQVSFFSVVAKLSRVYKHRKRSMQEKGPFIHNNTLN
ncbi:MAG: glycosyltransferase [Ginsengibacter sp.]